MADYTTLPDDLPVPEDDGAAAHLPGAALPSLALRTTDGRSVDVSDLGAGRSVIYVYPLSGRPGVELPHGWDEIPGARGCTTEACDFRDHLEDLQDAGVVRVHGFSSQSTDYQAELVERLRLPFAMLSDETMAMGDALQLPTFTTPGNDRLYKRLTLVIREGRIEHVFYPVFPPNTHVRQVLTWLSEHPAATPRHS